MLEQPDGRIVAAGVPRNCDRLALARYMFDGSLDPTFGNAGVSVSETVEDTSAIALQPDGKIIASAGGHFLSSPLGTTLVRVLGQAPPAEPFSSLDTKLHSDKARADFDGTFRLGEANDGIDPATERVAVTLGSFEIVIPAGSFVLDSHHRWSFNGEVGTTRIEMTIQPEQATSKSGLYDFDYRATGLTYHGSKVSSTSRSRSVTTSATTAFAQLGDTPSGAGGNVCPPAHQSRFSPSAARRGLASLGYGVWRVERMDGMALHSIARANKRWRVDKPDHAQVEPVADWRLCAGLRCEEGHTLLRTPRLLFPSSQAQPQRKDAGTG